MRWRLLPIAMCFACQDINGNEAGTAPVFEVSGDRAQLGYDAPFAIVVRPAAARGSPEIRWTQVEGPALRDIAVTEQGHRFAARTPRLADCREGEVPWGIIPLSPRTRGQIAVQAEWRLAGDGAPHRERITLSAAVRSRGLPNVPVDQRLYLGGPGWRVKEAPPGARATLENGDGVGTLRPDARGIWELIDGEGRALRIQAGRYLDTPLDCGRGGCHLAIARAAQSSSMTWALARRFQERAPPSDATSSATPSSEIACAAACHATGEPGTHDGGFFDVASDLHLSSSLDSVRRWADLPRPLRRLGSVGCLACHGPSALPEADARWSILRSDVCAHCHDAPPRYGHVVAWQTTSMARADRNTRARSDQACTPCHTSWGFLRDIDHPVEDETRSRVPPAAVGTIGITCPACHAVHDAFVASDTRNNLLRAPRLSALFDDVPAEARARSATCLICHAPRRTTQLAQASASALWVGRGGIDPETGAALVGPSPHLAIEGGCVGCHREGPADAERGASHGFRADRRRCAPCHASTGDRSARDVDWAEERARVAREARDLWADLGTVGARTGDASSKRAPSSTNDDDDGPPHATVTEPSDLRTPLGRAAYDLSLLLEDRGFLAHNLPYARLLLEKAKPPIERAFRRVEKERSR